MTTREFIERQYLNGDGKERTESSVVKDGRGWIYSYGYHYPLMFNLYGYNFVNTEPWSTTTARHRHWALQALGFTSNYIGVKLDVRASQVIAGGDHSADIKRAREVLRCLANELRVLKANMHRMEDKHNTDTYKYRNLKSNLITLDRNIAIVEQLTTGEEEGEE